MRHDAIPIPQTGCAGSAAILPETCSLYIAMAKIPVVPAIVPRPVAWAVDLGARRFGAWVQTRLLALAGALWVLACRCAPNRCRINRVIARRYFRRVHRRSPLPIAAEQSTINDFIFHRMTGNRWSALQRRCVDKVSAAAEAARLAPGLRAPRNRAVITLGGRADWPMLFEHLQAFAGEAVIAKPAHGSGAVIDLRHGVRPEQVRRFHAASRADYFWQMRETQYAGLPRRIVVEEAIRHADGSRPDDFKFMCVHGRPLLCQVDHDRLGAGHVRRLFRVPDFTPFCPQDGVAFPPHWKMPDRAMLARAVATAERLSAPFDYVRIEFLLGDDLYFGEFTFSPGASLGRYPEGARGTVIDSRYDMFLMQGLRDYGRTRRGEMPVLTVPLA